MTNLTKRIIKRILPGPFQKWASQVFFNYKINKVQKNHEKALQRIQGKEKIKVVFLLIHESVWKYDELYKLMEKDERFDPLVLVCPYTPYGEKVMLRELNQAYQAFETKGFNVIKSLNEATGEWLDVKKVLKPDLVFFTNPHNITKNPYLISNFLDTLTCYVPYAFMTPKTYNTQFNQFFHNTVWKAFYETPIHKKIAKKYARNGGRNVVVTGYPGCDTLIDKTYTPDDKWILNDRNIKRIIWAPHHLMKEGLKTSNFLDYYQLMLDIAKKYRNEIQIAFKPHPLIKPKLYEYPEWGVKRTDDYYNSWKNLDNGQLEEGDYIDLFLTSDALIHDSGSFITEYLFTGKPELFMISNDKVMNGWNEYGEMALSMLYYSKRVDDIYNFIENTILAGKDLMKDERSKFINDVLIPPNGVSASENIYKEILKVINKKNNEYCSNTCRW